VLGYRFAMQDVALLREWGRKLRADEPEEPVVAGPGPAVWARLQRQRDARADRARQLTLWR